MKTLCAVAGCVLLTLVTSACVGGEASNVESNAPSATAPPPSPDSAGVSLRGWPFEAVTLACPGPSVRYPKADPLRFDHVSRLVFCPPRLPTETLTAEQDGFDAVMRQLSAPDIKGVYSCPLMPYGGPDKTLVILAVSDEGAFRVRIPAGICGWMQPNLTRALRQAHVDVGHAVTTF